MSLSLNFPTIKPSLNLNFAKQKRLDSRITFTRASGATYFDSAGVMQTAGNGVARFDHDPITGESLGFLIEEQRTNSIRNNTMVGAVAGTPGTLPTNWGTTLAGLTQEVVGTGTEAGINYIDIRFSGTTTGTQFNVFPETSTGIAVTNETTYVWGFYWRIVAGTLTNISSSGLSLNGHDSGGAFIGGFTAGSYVGSPTPTSTMSRVSRSFTAANASLAFGRPNLFFLTTVGSAIDITLRIGLPQFEQGAFATSVIPTTGSAATRLADVATMTGTNFSSWYRQDEGTILAAYSVAGYNPAAASAFNRTISVDDGTTTNQISMSNTNIGSNLYPYSVMTYNNVTQAEFYVTAAAFGVNTTRTTVLAYKFNDTVFITQGLAATTDTSGTVPVVNTLRLGGTAAGTHRLNGHIRRLAYYPVRLSNSQLQALTL